MIVMIADNSLDSDDEPADLDVSDNDPDDDIPLLELYDEGGLVLYSAEDLSEEVDVINLESLEIVSEVEVVTLDAEVVIPEEEIVAAVVLSNKRKADDKVPFVNRLTRSKLSKRKKLSYEFSYYF